MAPAGPGCGHKAVLLGGARLSRETQSPFLPVTSPSTSRLRDELSKPELYFQMDQYNIINRAVQAPLSQTKQPSAGREWGTPGDSNVQPIEQSRLDLRGRGHGRALELGGQDHTRHQKDEW